MAYSTKHVASMYEYDAAIATTIHAVDQYHAIEGLLEGMATGIDGFTFKASANGVITNTANNGGVLRVTDVAHGLATGDYVTLNGMGDVAHVGSTAVTVINDDTFDCDDITYNSIEDTGFWQRGSSLLAKAGSGGVYLATWSISVQSAGNNKNYKFELSLDNTHLDELAAERKIGVAGDLGSMAAGGIVEIMAGQHLFFTVKGTTDDTNLTIKHCNVHIHKI